MPPPRKSFHEGEPRLSIKREALEIACGTVEQHISGRMFPIRYCLRSVRF